MDAGTLIVILASAGIFPIGQATVPRYDGDPGRAEVSLAELTRPAATIALSGTCVLRVAGKDVNEYALQGDNAVCFLGTCHNCVAPTWALQTTARTCTTPHTTRVTQSRMACWVHTWCGPVSCDAVGAFTTGHTCHPVKCVLSALASTDHPLWHDGKRKITLPARRTASAHPSPAGKRSSSRMPSLTTGSSSTVRGLRASVSMATPPQVSLWAALPSQTRAPRVLSLLPQLLAERRPGKFTMTRAVSPRHLVGCVSNPLTVWCGLHSVKRNWTAVAHVSVMRAIVFEVHCTTVD